MSSGNSAWYALSVAPRKEKIIAHTLRTKGFEDFLPLYSSSRQWSDRIKKLERPLFPGYVFCRFDPQARGPIVMTPGVMAIVGFGKLPEPIPDSEISALQTVCRVGLDAIPYPNPKVGSRVRMLEGPLKGLEGILVEDKKTRLILSVTLLQRSVAVEIDREWVAEEGTFRSFDPE